MMKRNVAAVLVAGLVLGGGATAYAAGPARGARRECVAQLKAAGQRRGPEARQALRTCMADAGLAKLGAAGLFERAVHGDLVVRAKGGFQTYTFDKGKVESASADSITLTRPDGQQVTLSITADTRHRGAWPPQAGKPAVVVSQSGRAVLVAQSRDSRVHSLRKPQAMYSRRGAGGGPR